MIHIILIWTSSLMRINWISSKNWHWRISIRTERRIRWNKPSRWTILLRLESCIQLKPVPNIFSDVTPVIIGFMKPREQVKTMHIMRIVVASTVIWIIFSLLMPDIRWNTRDLLSNRDYVMSKPYKRWSIWWVRARTLIRILVIWFLPFPWE